MPSLAAYAQQCLSPPPHPSALPQAREAIEREVRDSMAYAPPPHAAPYGAPPPAYHGSYDHRAYGGYAPPADNRGYGYGR